MRLIAEEASKESWCFGWDGRQSGFCSSTTTGSRGGKQMWCVAELDQAYIAKMENTLAVYEKPLSAAEPVTLHRNVREPIPMKPGSVRQNAITSMK